MERVFPTINLGKAHFDNSLKLKTRFRYVQMWRVFWLSWTLKIMIHLRGDCLSIHSKQRLNCVLLYNKSILGSIPTA